MFAVGTARGGVLVDVDQRTRVRLLADSDIRRSARAASRPAASRPAASRPAASRPAASRPAAPPGHDGPVVALDFSSDGRYLVSIGGHSAIWWDLDKRRMLRQVRGPHDLTAVAFGPSSSAAFFANSRGHLYRWRHDQSQAEAVRGFFCRPTPVPPERQRLDPDKRCTVGHYSLEDYKQVCLYPVTQLVRRGQQLARACREGTVGVMDLRSRRIRWSNLAGHLRGLAFVGDKQLLFGRADGELRLWDLDQQRVVRSLVPGVRADAVGSDGGLIAAAQGARLRLWWREQTKVIGAVTVPRRVVWLRLKRPDLELLLDDGRLVAHQVVLQ